MPSEMAITLWCLYMLDAFTETEGAPVIAVNYDLLLEDPAGQLARLAKWLGRDAPTGKALDQVLDWLTPELRHSHTGGDRLPIGSRTAWLYEVAADLAADRIDLQAVRPELRELRTALSRQPILDLIDSELAGEDRLRGWEGFQGPASDREEAISELAQLLDAERQRNSLLANEVDDMRDGQEELARELEAQRTETAASVANSANINEQLQESELRVGALEVELDVMRASTSWLVTAPLRRLTRGIRSAAPVSRPEEKKKS
jgi:hypothetical protein